LVKKFAHLTRYIRNLRGGSQPILAEASDGLVYVVKFTNNPQGPNLAFNESAGSELFRACRVAVPSWKALVVTDLFLEKNPSCWIQTPTGRLRPDSGLCFGSLFLGGNGKRILEILPGSSFQRVRNRPSFWLAWLIDICAEHADARQALFVEDIEGWLDAHFVDHGHLFGGPRTVLKKNFIASRYLDPRIYQDVSSIELQGFMEIVRRLDGDQLWKRVRALPAEWKAASALNSFAQCLDRLSTPGLLRRVLDTMVDSHRKTNQLRSSDFQGNGDSSASLLRLGIPGTGPE
jgi:hypothetical protein